MIRPEMTAWRECSLRLITLGKERNEEKRDDAISQIEQLLNERDQLQPKISAPFTPEERAVGDELIRLEKEVQKSLAEFTKSIRLDITQSQAKKENMNSYVNPYGNMMKDGAYYDTKQ